MSTQQKLRGGSTSELTKLKEKWLGMAEPARDFWRSRFCSSDTQAALRATLKAKLKVDLTRDNQLTEFRQWDDSNQQRELMAEKIEQRKSELLAGGMKLEEAQEILLTEASAYSVAARDFELGVKVSAQISKTTTSKLDARKLALLEKKAAQADQTDKVLTDAELTPAQRAQRIKEIYGR